eukprot:362265-Chlamydomonas_euryale.AAC.11
MSGRWEIATGAVLLPCGKATLGYLGVRKVQYAFMPDTVTCTHACMHATMHACTVAHGTGHACAAQNQNACCSMYAPACPYACTYAPTHVCTHLYFHKKAHMHMCMHAPDAPMYLTPTPACTHRACMVCAHSTCPCALQISGTRGFRAPHQRPVCLAPHLPAS